MCYTEDDKIILKEISDDLGIEQDNIYHFILLGGVEMVGEIFDDYTDEVKEDRKETGEDKEFLIVNPIKVLRNSWLSDEGYETQHFFVDWNPCSEGPFTPLNSSLIVSKSKPNPDTMKAYLWTVHDSYYPDTVEFESDFDGDTPSDSEAEDMLFSMLDSIDKTKVKIEPMPGTDNVISILPFLKDRK